MADLKTQLGWIEQKFGKDHWMAQQVRDQIAAKGTSAQELWLTGSVPRQTNNGDHTTTTQGATKKE
jgi:hypothetical protein